MSEFRPRPILTILLAALPMVGGCLDWSGDVAKYRGVLDDAQPSSRPAFAPDAPLPLVDALRVANADNEAIASAGEDYVQALAEKMRQAGNFLPTISLSPIYSLTQTKGSGASGIVIGGTPVGTLPGTPVDPNAPTNTPTNGTTGGTVQILGGGGGGTSDRFSVPLNASINGSLSNVSSYQSAARSVEQRKQLLLNQREAILLGVAQSYYDVLRFERQADVLRNSVALREEQVRDQAARLRLGSGRPLDVAQSRSDLAGVRASLIQAQTNATNARSALARLMGVAEVSGPLTDAFAPPAAVPALDGWVAGAVAARQDLLAAARFTEAARLTVDAAIRQYVPSVSINFDYFLHNDPASGQVYTAGITANVPIFSALAIESEIRRAWSAYRQAGLIESQTRRQVVDDVRQNYANLNGDRDQVTQLQLQVDAARQAVDLATRAYQVGAGTNLDRLQQQDNLLNAELNLLDQQFNAKSDYLGLLRATGRLATALQ